MDDFVLDTKEAYYPLEIGKYITYSVDSVRYSAQSGGGTNIDTSSFQWREMVIDTFREQIGGEVPFQRWDRSKELSLIHEKYHETFDRIEKPQGLYAYEFI